MNGNVIQVDYEKLETIAGRFGQMAEGNEALRSNVARGIEALRNGGWEGEGAGAFLSEMDGVMFPAVARLTNALEEAQKVTLEIVRVMREAEEEAARPFQNQAADTIPGRDPTPINAPDKHPLVVSDPANQFSDKYMDGLMGSRYQGGNSRKLAMAMRDLAENPDNPTAALREIAEARGRPFSEIEAEYKRYQTLRAEAIAAAERKDIDPPADLAEWIHTDPIMGGFMGTNDQLRYGQVVGDTFGIDPVFGALLNPTGGLVGPGNFALPMGEGALGYHGTFHDAAGYMYNYHDIGPGYDYLGQEPQRDPGDPLTGQRSGIRYWAKKVYVDPVVDFGQEISDAVGDWWGDLWN